MRARIGQRVWVFLAAAVRPWGTAADTVIVGYAAGAPDPTLPVRVCMTANVMLRFVLLYTMPEDAVTRAVAGVSDALAAGALSELPVHRFSLEECAAAHDAVQQGAVGKVLLQLGAAP